MPGQAAIRGLRFAVRVRVVAKYLGQAFLLLAALICVPAAVAVLTGQNEVALRYLAVILVFGACGVASSRMHVAANMLRNEALVITALVFTLSAFAMTFPLMGYGITFVDALFEAVSAITTTGLSTLEGVEQRPASLLFARAWMQWVGGLGILALVLALLIDPGVTWTSPDRRALSLSLAAKMCSSSMTTTNFKRMTRYWCWRTGRIWINSGNASSGRRTNALVVGKKIQRLHSS